MDVHAVLGVALRYWRTILATLLICSIAVVAYFMSQRPVYASTAVVNLLPRSGGAAGELKAALDYAQSQATTYAQLAGTETVLGPVRDRLQTTEDPGASCSVGAATEQAVIYISCRRGDPESSATFANAIAEQIIQALADFAPTGSSLTIEARQTQRAEPEPKPISPSLKSTLPMALGIGLVLALGQAYGRSFLDTRVESPDDVNRFTRIPVIGEIPFDEEVPPGEGPRRIEPFSIRAEAYRRLRTNLQFKALEGHGNVMLVTSSLPGEGKTATATAIASAFAQTGQRVILLDCDLRRPRIQDELQLPNVRGVSSMLLERGVLADYVQHLDEFDVMTSGPKPPNPSEILGSPLMRELFAAAKDAYDVVVLDSPPLLPVTDATVLARLGAGVIVVADTSRVRSRQLATALKALLTVEVPVLGIVLNKIKVGGVGGYYGYGYRSRYSYDYHYASESGKARRGAKPTSRSKSRSPLAALRGGGRRSGSRR